MSGKRFQFMNYLPLQNSYLGNRSLILWNSFVKLHTCIYHTELKCLECERYRFGSLLVLYLPFAKFHFLALAPYPFEYIVIKLCTIIRLNEASHLEIRSTLDPNL